jgi:hypothetical protein
MIPRAKRPQVKFPEAKIRQAVGSILPSGKIFKLKVSNSHIGRMKIVRVVTPAWKSLRPAERIIKLLEAVDAKLTPQERNGILRFSVLTPREYSEVVGRSWKRH